MQKVVQNDQWPHRTVDRLKASVLSHMLHRNEQDCCYRRLRHKRIETSNFLYTYVLRTTPRGRLLSYLLSNVQEVEEDFIQIWGRTYSGRYMEKLKNNLDSRCAGRDSKMHLLNTTDKPVSHVN